MEKVRFPNSRGLVLVGAHYPAETKKAVIICHGFLSNKDRSWFERISEELNAKGFAVLRFDFAGCGESDPGTISIRGQKDDLESALRFLKNKKYSEFGLMGESLGGLISLQVFAPEIKTMVLWAPVTEGKDPLRENSALHQLEKVSENAEKRVVRKKNGQEFHISQTYFEERKKIDQKTLLSNVKGPVLIIHGDADETIPLKASENAIKQLPKGSKLEIIPNGEHRLANHPEHVEKAIALTVDWFEKQMGQKKTTST